MSESEKDTAQLTLELERAWQEIRDLKAAAARQLQIEKALQASEEKYRLLIDNSTNPITFFDTEGNILLINRIGALNVGLRPDDCEGKTLHDLFPSDADAYLDRARRVLAAGKGMDFEDIVDLPSGKRWFLSNIQPVRDTKGNTFAVQCISYDITERKSTEKALIESEEKYRILVENSEIPITYLTLDGHILLLNKKGALNLGGNPGDFAGHSLTEVLPEMAEVTQSRIQQLCTKQEGAVFEDRIKLPAGDLWFLSSFQPVRDINGNIFAIQIMSQDISERKAAEEAIRASEERFRALVENAFDGVAIVGADGKTHYESPAISRIASMTPEEAIGVEFLNYAHPEDRERISADFTRMVQMESDSILNSIYRIRFKDGQYHFLEVMARNCITEPKIGGIVINYRDITERVIAENELRQHRDHLEEMVRERTAKLAATNERLLNEINERKQAEAALRESEEKYRSLVENINDAIFSIDTEGRFTYASPIIERIWGFKVGEVLGQNFTSFVVEEDLPGLLASYERTLDGVTEPFEFRIHDRNGTLRYISSSSRVLIQDGRPAGLTGIVTDVTERKKAEAKVLQMNRELAALNTIAQSVSQSLNLDDILNNALDSIQDILDLDRSFISLLSAEGDCLELKIHRGIDPDSLSIIARWSPSEGLMGQAFRSGEFLYVESFDAFALPDSDIDEKLVDIAREYNLSSLIYIPLQTKGRTLGVLAAVTTGDRILTLEERNLLVTIGHQISTAIENAVLYREVQQEEVIRREGLRQAILAQEEERKRISRELHDQTSQVLTGASVMLEASIAALPYGFQDVKSRLKEIRLSLTNMLVDVRNIIYELRPTLLDDLGLVAAARWQAEEFLEKAGIKAEFEVRGRVKKLSAEVETALFRMIQEATTNIIKHSKARSARIALTFSKNLVTLNVEDDGRGFDLHQARKTLETRKGLGFLSMQERTEILNGTFDLQSQPRQGTRITIAIPV